MIKVTRTPGGRIRLGNIGYPSSLAIEGAVDLTPQSAARLIEALKDALEGHVVRVSPMGGPPGRAYTYCDPSGTLKVGDLVEVPFGLRNAAVLGHVVGLGRDGYDGELKDVTAKLAKTLLAQESPF